MIKCQNQIPLKGIWHDKPADKWEEGFLTGNGTMGLITYGHPIRETLIGNHSKLFLPMGNTFAVPDLSDLLPELRKIITEQGYQAGLAFHYQQARTRGYQGLTMSDPYHPAFHLFIETGIASVDHYQRSLNYQTGEIIVNYRGDGDQYQSRSFVSQADHIIVYQIENFNRKLKLKLKLDIYQIPQLDGTFDIQDNHFKWQYQYTKKSGGYTVLGQIIAPNALIDNQGQVISVTNTHQVRLLIRIIPNLSDQSLADHLTPYQLLYQAHQRIHQEKFDRVQLDLTDNDERAKNFTTLLEEAKQQPHLSKVFIEKVYDASRFMYICSSGESTPNLQGIWSGTFEPAWSGDYTFDTNVQLSIASALSSNLSEGLHGLFDLIDALLPGFKENAKNYYGCKGIMIPVHASNYGQHLHWNQEWPLHFWTCGAGWIGHWYYQYYRYTGDQQFLQQVALPYLEEVAKFYEDFLVEDPDGDYRFIPSYSAENGCGDNATQDVAVAKEVLNHLIEGYQVLAIDSEKITKWRQILNKLPAYQINEDGALKEWLTPGKAENYNHRHFSHLYPIFQSREFTAETDPVMFEASRQAFQKRLEAWLLNDDGDTTSTHGRMHTALCATQFHMPELIKEVIMLVIKNNCFYPSLMMSHYHNLEVFNVDGNGAFPQVIHEMLVDYHHQTLYLLQALPDDLDRGVIKGVKLPDQIEVVELAWDLTKRMIKLTLVSCLDHQLKVKLPLFSEASIQGRMHGEAVIQLAKNHPNHIEIKL
ncbi:glycosyl hydrolase family 95 catalytic domain-containing protein [Amphibacillus cookii]|uniref:glycosyl hydrolase family 95 catalytic domain-containing protein n=1 Tax=Amphibacillus cookii TaxID=767787 RepID=UPI00195D96EC|nr:glycoside hydrolase N-terminal domain-containing protein [Amphibacillus cookii]MBM7541599.1 hypothetical protein [Amphibacillus cookii]